MRKFTFLDDKTVELAGVAASVAGGCPFNCAEVIMGRAGIKDIIHLNTTDFGIIKGKTPVTEDEITEIAEHIKNLNHEKV